MLAQFAADITTLRRSAFKMNFRDTSNRIFTSRRVAAENMPFHTLSHHSWRSRQRKIAEFAKRNRYHVRGWVGEKFCREAENDSGWRWECLLDHSLVL